jgi:hypothetical protein
MLSNIPTSQVYVNIILGLMAVNTAWSRRCHRRLKPMYFSTISDHLQQDGQNM